MGHVVGLPRYRGASVAKENGISWVKFLCYICASPYCCASLYNVICFTSLILCFLQRPVAHNFPLHVRILFIEKLFRLGVIHSYAESWSHQLSSLISWMNFTPLSKCFTLLACGVEDVLGDFDHLEKALSEQRRLYRCVGLVMTLYFGKSMRADAEWRHLNSDRTESIDRAEATCIFSFWPHVYCQIYDWPIH